MTFSQMEFEGRITKLQSQLTERGVGWAALFDDVSMLYYAGTIQSGVLVVPAQGTPSFSFAVRQNVVLKRVG